MSDTKPEIAFVKPALPRAGALVLPLPEGTALVGLAAEADAATGGAITRGIEASGFSGRKGQATTLFAPGAGIGRVLLLGLGKPDELTPEDAESAGGALWPGVASATEVLVAADTLPPALAARMALGVVLRGWRFDKYRTTEKPEEKPKAEKVAIATSGVPAAKAAWKPLKAVAEGVFLSRELVSEPPNVLTPAEMADRCKALTRLGVDVEILGPKDMKKLGFGALLGVAQGSACEPRMVVMRWNGARKKGGQPVCFVGKGVTFDTGGISIKPAAGMEDMKWDMAGAGCVVGLMAALAGREAKVDVVGLVGLVENMPGSKAQRPGDVVTSASGQTIEIINTDAEGRLVLADVLWYAQKQFAPKYIVDLATLTGAIIVALGHEHAGLFSNDDALAQKLLAAGTVTGESLWRMPLGEAYDKQIKSDIADMKNVGGRPGGSITAAQFIQRFIDDGTPWAHLDIAGTAWSTKDTATVPKGATAYGVRLLDRIVADHDEDA
ncbi:leucyl aminopeptidase [Humitalea rosea]|uniref:Probable cytosol aminopeptidase n=1 Tax=Humitalea rosea TaxID=990373 RepID=A0A2W7IUH2_9PROT|nr:leucyl aminopeptidase [Humitalea rosea]PZW43127.1 leucyl aminopeptidase [Humitalea rosea]